ncbi:MAG: nicotinate phosphoribosyltransferase [Coriobacteriia bacterium]
MGIHGSLYGDSMALLTDLYQLTMAQGYWKSGKAGQEAVFHLFFRANPFGGGYAVAAGLEQVVGYLEGFRFSSDDLQYLGSLANADGSPLFEEGFLEYVAGLDFRCDVEAVPEGTVVFPYEPLVRVSGPLVQCQLVETALLNLVNFQTLIATKTARVVTAARGRAVVEFGLRRAQGPDGGLTASRAAYIGGCVGTSNVLAGKIYGIPVKGTHAHSWVMVFGSEPEAFEEYARVFPSNCILLVDTYDTLEGVRNAIDVGRRLRQRGYDLAGIRLDSGDLVWLSRQAREMLDDAGFEKTAIVASNELDEWIVDELVDEGAAIDMFGVGTRLVTGDGQPSLGGVYKLSAVRGEDGEWRPRIKVSDQAAKVTNPGVLQVRRFFEGSGPVGDMVYDEIAGVSEPPTIVDPHDPTRRKRFAGDCSWEDLLVPVFRGGERVMDLPSLDEIRERAAEQLASFDPSVKRLRSPYEYPVGLEEGLHERKTRLIMESRGFEGEGESR